MEVAILKGIFWVSPNDEQKSLHKVVTFIWPGSKLLQMEHTIKHLRVAIARLFLYETYTCIMYYAGNIDGIDLHAVTAISNSNVSS